VATTPDWGGGHIPGMRRCSENDSTLSIEDGAVSAVWLRARTQLRGRAWVTVLLAALVGLAGGMVLAAVGGARRTEAALPRFQAYDRPPADAVIYAPGGGQQRRQVRGCWRRCPR
jgi:hypothetical protein